MALIVAIIPRVQSQALGSRKKLIWTQALSGAALLGIIVAASVGLAITPNLGQTVEFLKDISCVEMSSSMDCLPFGFLSNGGCGLEWSYETSAVVVACPSVDASGYRYFPSNATFSDIGNEAVTQTECQRYCDDRSESIPVIAIPPVSSSTAEELMDGLARPAGTSVESVAAQVPLSAPLATPSRPPARVVNADSGLILAPVVTDRQQANLVGGGASLSTVPNPLPNPLPNPPPNPPPNPLQVTPFGGVANEAGEATSASVANPVPSQAAPATPAGGINPWG